ncbi:hypothetical protein BOTBODRAFT_170530 [Botryobasidium botryosum FD-172 SS1]|uniref:Ion transport domain-containing protein n=1 Tax=Botryobasidium botryosum (strain FD-172 SS1) TaxID=930990 RepID=A0A067MV08_BOTB1|nr:hypothetical protein BOTBODRAFT_170530 [Botryobasidium botryosum FD-172 SS1]
MLSIFPNEDQPRRASRAVNDHEEHHHGTDCEWEPLLSMAELDATPVYPLIHEIRQDVIHYIDVPLSYDTLNTPDLIYTLVRPLTEKYHKKGNMAVVFCYLLNRVHFLRDQTASTNHLSDTRAALCEILAQRTLKLWSDDTLALATVLCTSWLVYSGAPQKVLDKAAEEEGEVPERVGNAIELAIIGNARRFIKSTACQKIIDGIWSGKIVYQAESDHAILSDTYKRKSIHFYDPHAAPLLDHYRLKVPAVQSVLEYFHFLILFILFVITVERTDVDFINRNEMIFIVYALGFTLQRVASIQEHGFKVFSANLWNGFDITFITIYMSYACCRLYGIYYDIREAKSLGIDILALAAILMFPRLAFVSLSNNLMVLSLRSMFLEFALLMFVAAFCFGGFLYALFTLGREKYGGQPGLIAWWMLDLWFGLDASGFDRADTFHPYFGPPLMVGYACLSNTLLLTVLVSILSNTFSTVSSDASAEYMFRRAVSTLEGVKADALLSYQPPLNLIACVIMVPASFVLTPRWFHKVNVFLIRVTSCPILLIIALFERRWESDRPTTLMEVISRVTEAIRDILPRWLVRLNFFEGIAGSGADIDSIFKVEDELKAEELLSLMDDDQSPTESEGVPFPKVDTTPSVPRAVPSRLLGINEDMPLRRRRTSVNAATAALPASPLAQIFGPIVDVSPPRHDLATQMGLSHAPVGRKISLPSRRHRNDSQFMNGIRPRVPSLLATDMSESPQQHDPETVQEIEDDEEDHPDHVAAPEVTRELRQISERQARMEGQLEDLMSLIRGLNPTGRRTS